MERKILTINRLDFSEEVLKVLIKKNKTSLCLLLLLSDKNSVFFTFEIFHLLLH